ncbi:helix-turn-helix domain-containing protein [Scytonema sp. UIC 10036]|uniref:helix-turn-helix domain-containing protein n=1 Tax=Scytonema sp. UIC 10036 TaxID=2304196 RepID=UPI0012DA3D66|nr:helix-turn-helix domain-containing protein [Scytonema sp. UIC 10036]MUH00273.1 helix-turn-helix domain-containing protein [Scytonema sp. UIC 10036]
MSPYSVTFDTTSHETSNGEFLTPFQRKLLQKSLQENLPECYQQRIQIMLLADEGKSQTEICRTLGCSRATARHWTHIARTGMAHQWQDCPIGRPTAVNQEYLHRLHELVSQSPREHGYSFQRWTASWLRKHLAKEFGVEVSDRHIHRLLKQMGLSTRSKLSDTQQNASGDTLGKSSRILIRDLNLANPSDNTEFLPVNLAKLGTNLDIHGGKSIQAAVFSATVKQYYGIFSSPGGLPVMS